jgi:predicted enzyme related to lactoylglutathione lyase
MLKRRWRLKEGVRVMGKVVHFEIPTDDIARAVG